MQSEPGAAAGGRLRELARIALDSRLAIAIAILLVVARSLVFTSSEQAAFNSDHAIVGLMAKHLAEGKAFPLFFYGQSYMLGVEAWLAAPLFLLAGPSLAALQLPLVALNALVAALLVVLLRKELGLGAWTALIASLVFVLPPPATALGLVEANGGSVEPFLYVLLLWVFRDRPALFGAILGFGFVHREFTIYGLAALLVLRLAGRRPFQRAGLRHAAIVAASCCAAMAALFILRYWSSPLGPGTSLTEAALPQTNLGELAARFCWRASALPARAMELWREHLPVLFGTRPRSLPGLGITSRTSGQGLTGLTPAMAIALLVAVWRSGIGLWAGRRRRESPAEGSRGSCSFAGYLILVGVISMMVYGALSCGRITPDTLRYDLLGLLAAVGLSALFFAVERRRPWKAAAVLALLVLSATSAWWHGRLLCEYVTAPPPDDARRAAERLVAEGVTRARGSYWVAYQFAFLTGERLIVASTGPVRITLYQQLAGNATVLIRESPCEGGSQLAGKYYRCPAP